MSLKGSLLGTSLSISLSMLMMARLQADDDKVAGKQDKPQSIVATVEWSKLAETNQLPKAGSIEKDGDKSVLKIVRGPQDQQLVPLVTIEKPKLREYSYVVNGKVKFEGVSTDGFLEMWSHFPEPKPGAYFSRTMAETGPMGKLRGTSPWREFVLPFFIDDKSFPMPNKLQLNVYLPDKGTVWLTDLEVEEKPIEQMRKELLGASSTWFGVVVFAAIAISVAAVFAIAVVILGLVNRNRGPERVDSRKELLRMRALDIGS